MVFTKWSEEILKENDVLGSVRLAQRVCLDHMDYIRLLK